MYICLSMPSWIFLHLPCCVAFSQSTQIILETPNRILVESESDILELACFMATNYSSSFSPPCLPVSLSYNNHVSKAHT